MSKYSETMYPLTIIADRYDGCYSGGAFTAWPLDYFDIPDGPDGSDPECRAFWDSYEYPVGKGRTAQEAIDDLLPKMDAFQEETRRWLFSRRGEE